MDDSKASEKIGRRRSFYRVCLARLSVYRKCKSDVFEFGCGLLKPPALDRSATHYLRRIFVSLTTGFKTAKQESVQFDHGYTPLIPNFARISVFMFATAKSKAG